MQATQTLKHWRFFGLFATLVFVSTLLGIVFDLSSMRASQSFRAIFSNVSVAVKYEEMGNFQLWSAVQGVFSASEFFCVSLSKLAVIDRMMGPLREVFSRERKPHMVRLLSICERVTLAVVITSNSCGICCRIAGAVISFQIRALLAGNPYSDVDAGSNISILIARGFETAGVQFVFLAISLIALITVFLLAGLFFRVRFRAYAEAGEGSIVSQVRRRVYGTVGIVFVSFLVRVCWVIWAAVGFFSYTNGERLFAFSGACLSDPCSPVCFSTDQINSNAIVLSPSIYRLIWLFSGPVTMLVALWGLRPQVPKSAQGDHSARLLASSQA